MSEADKEQPKAKVEAKAKEPATMDPPQFHVLEFTRSQKEEAFFEKEIAKALSTGTTIKTTHNEHADTNKTVVTIVTIPGRPNYKVKVFREPSPRKMQDRLNAFSELHQIKLKMFSTELSSKSNGMIAVMIYE